MTNDNKKSLCIESNKKDFSKSYNQGLNFLEKILSDEKYHRKEHEEFRTRILQDRNNQKECGITWSKAF
ncbi:hypothetical protein [Wolbachia endosymbiont of Pentidionis agamae]|uniref:hypothetical protein n=1 Tax=Wolbachia endosymbiont of Pentidionis agamae TaxID=3110435 RepID=UPI002FD5ACAA